jgi:hypothetical protein
MGWNGKKTYKADVQITRIIRTRDWYVWKNIASFPLAEEKLRNPGLPNFPIPTLRYPTCEMNVLTARHMRLQPGRFLNSGKRA